MLTNNNLEFLHIHLFTFTRGKSEVPRGITREFYSAKVRSFLRMKREFSTEKSQVIFRQYKEMPEE